MVIKFYCGCGKKVSIPEDHRDMLGSCPSCGEEISLKKADPSAIEREPMLVVDIDSSDPGDATVKIRDRKKPAVEKDTDELLAESGSKPETDTDEIDTGGVLRDMAKEIDEEDETGEINYTGGGRPAGDMEEHVDEEKGTDELGEAAPGAGSGTEVLDEDKPSVDRRAGTEELYERKPARLHLKDKSGQDVFFELKKHNRIGRSKDAEICLVGAGVSREHCTIVWGDGHYVIKDGGSRNGIRINRKKVDTARLTRGDLIQLGDLELHYME